jgi:hypothetical protein
VTISICSFNNGSITSFSKYDWKLLALHLSFQSFTAFHKNVLVVNFSPQTAHFPTKPLKT